MSLREELAERLYTAYWKPTQLLVSKDIYPFSKQDEAEKRAWLSAADECIRQMEWARMEVAKAWDQAEGSGTAKGARRILYPPAEWKYDEGIPLTIAPPDWKPSCREE